MTAVVVVFAVLITVTLALTYFTFKRKPSPLASPNTIELTIDKKEPLRVSFVGDSMVDGLFATQNSRGFHGLMVDEWRKGGPVADQVADTIGGTARGTLANPDFPPRGQHLYIVELGTNDVARVDHWEFRTEYGRLLDRIHSASPDAALVCVGPWRPKEIADTFDTVIKDLCEVRGGVFRRISDLFTDTSLKGPAGVRTFRGVSDAFHPNDRGHRAIADRILGAIRLNRQG